MVPHVTLAVLLVGLLLPAHARSQTAVEVGRPAIDYSEMSRQVGQGLVVGFDAVIVRPLYVCATIVGAALFVPVLIVSAAGGSEGRQEAYELFIDLPSKGIYERPLGEF